MAIANIRKLDVMRSGDEFINIILIFPIICSNIKHIKYYEITQVKIDYSDQIARYYRFLHKDNMPEYSLLDNLRYKRFPILSAGLNVLEILKDTTPPVQSETAYSSMTKDQLIKKSENRYSYWTKDTPDTGERGYAHNQELVCKIVELCLAHDIRPVLVTTPITSILNNIYAERSPDFFNTFYRFSREICEKYPGLKFFDYSHDSRFENDFSLFKDADHLNAYGAVKFTFIIVADLEASGILKAPSK
jgi:hypothetical protein